jgi:hypothetical protein
MSPAWRKALAKLKREFGTELPPFISQQIEDWIKFVHNEGFISGYNASNLMHAKKGKAKK